MDYKKLDHANLETRFLRCLGLSGGLVALELVTASLGDPPIYNALSYHWGDSSVTRPILLNGSRIKVSKNLADALDHAGLIVDSYIWVDALCINQTDLYEKSVQLKRMGLIYSSAQHTIAWVGNVGPSTKYALTLLDNSHVERATEQLRRDLFDTDKAGTIKQRLSRLKVHVTNALGEQAFPAMAVTGLYDILSRPYWGRVWILQEIAKARRVEVVCGKLRFDLWALILASQTLTGLPAIKRDLFTALAKFREQEQRSVTSKAPRSTLLQALIWSRHSKATDDRDKVYSLLGLAADASDLVPTPTYTKSVRAVFEEVTASIVRSSQQSDILVLSSWAPLSLRYADSPPWVVDWAGLMYSVPPWLVNPKSNRFQICSGMEFTGDQLYTTGRLVRLIDVDEGSLVGGGVRSETTSRRLDLNVACKVMDHVSLDLLERLCRRVSRSASLAKRELTDALSRMIRDADKNIRREEYDLSSIRGTLLSLGEVQYHEDTVWYWARQYNNQRAQEVSTILTNPQANKSSRLWPFARGVQDRSIPPPNPEACTVRPLPAAFKLWERVFKTLTGNLEFPLSFVYVDGVGLVMGRKNRVNKGHAIYQLDNCHLPVVLRETRRGTFLLCSEVCISTHPVTGEWSSGTEAVEELFVSCDLAAPKPRKLTVDFRPHVKARRARK